MALERKPQNLRGYGLAQDPKVELDTSFVDDQNRRMYQKKGIEAQQEAQQKNFAQRDRETRVDLLKGIPTIESNWSPEIKSKINAEIDAFIKTIDAKLKADEKARWQFKMKQYADKIAAQKEQVRIAEAKSIRDDEYRENQSQRDAEYREKQAVRNSELDKIRVSAYRDVAVEYAKNQPKTINYNNIYWR